MNIPGFTAEASLYKTNEYNNKVLIAPIDSMQVLPQYNRQNEICIRRCYGGVEAFCDTFCFEPRY